MTRTLGVSCVIALLMTAVVSTAQATEVEYVSPRQMGDESALVVRGKVASVRSFWNDAHTKIFTETVIQVDETYKGQGAGEVRVVQMGGVVDNMQMHVYGALSWHPGEEVLLYLDRLDVDRYRVAGFSQGRFHIERDPVTGEPFIRRPAEEGAEIVGAPPERGEGPFGGSARVPLGEFVKYTLGQR
jgi:hypothetical protein